MLQANSGFSNAFIAIAILWCVPLDAIRADTTATEPDDSQKPEYAATRLPMSSAERGDFEQALTQFKAHVDELSAVKSIAAVDRILSTELKTIAEVKRGPLALPIADYSRRDVIRHLKNRLGDRLCEKVFDVFEHVICDSHADPKHRIGLLVLIGKLGVQDNNLLARVEPVLVQDDQIARYCKLQECNLPLLFSATRVLVGESSENELDVIRDALKQDLRPYIRCICLEALACAHQLQADNFSIQDFDKLENREYRQRFACALACSKAGQRTLLGLLNSPEGVIDLKSVIAALAGKIGPNDFLWPEFAGRLSTLAIEGKWNDEIRALSAMVSFLDSSEEFRSEYVRAACESGSRILLSVLLVSWNPNEAEMLTQIDVLTKCVRSRDDAERQTAVLIIATATPKRPTRQLESKLREVLKLASADHVSEVRRSSLFLVPKIQQSNVADRGIFAALNEMIQHEDNPLFLLEVLQVASTASGTKLDEGWPQGNAGRALTNDAGLKWGREHSKVLKERARVALVDGK